MRGSLVGCEDVYRITVRLGVVLVVLLLMPGTLSAGPGDPIDQLPNDWSYSTIGLAWDPVRQVVRYAHESQSSSHNPTIYDYDYVAGAIVSSVALSTQNPVWPWQIDNRDGATYDPDTGTYFLPDYNGDLSYADDNIVEVDALGNIVNAWETDDEVGSNDCANGGEIDEIIDISYDPDHPRRYYATAAYEGNAIYSIELSAQGALWEPNSWVLLDTIVPPDLDGIMRDILGIEWDPVAEGYWVSDWHSGNIALLDRDFNLVYLMSVETAGGYSSGITPMNDVAQGEPYQLWLTDFSSDTTTIVESLSSRPITDPQADVAVTKDDGLETFVPGMTITYSVVISNNGPHAAQQVRLVDTAPADTTITSWACTAAGGAICPNASGSGDIDETAALLPVGATLVYLVDVEVSLLKDPLDPLVNTATVSSATTDPDVENDVAVDSNASPLQGSGIVVLSDGRSVYTPGTTVVYQMVVANFNPPPTPGANVGITNVPPAGTTMSWSCVGLGGASCPSGSGSGGIDTTAFLSFGSALWFTIEVDVPSDYSGILDSTVSLDSTLSFLPAAQVTDSDTQVSVADLSVSKTDGRDTYLPGTVSVYALTVTNNGPSDASDVRVRDTAPAGTSITGWSCTASGGAVCPSATGAGDLDELIPTLPAGGTLVYETTLAIGEDYGEGGGLESALSNSVRVSGADLDPNVANNSSTDVDSRGVDAAGIPILGRGAVAFTIVLLGVIGVAELRRRTLG